MCACGGVGVSNLCIFALQAHGTRVLHGEVVCFCSRRYAGVQLALSQTRMTRPSTTRLDQHAYVSSSWECLGDCESACAVKLVPFRAHSPVRTPDVHVARQVDKQVFRIQEGNGLESVQTALLVVFCASDEA